MEQPTGPPTPKPVCVKSLVQGALEHGSAVRRMVDVNPGCGLAEEPV